jgi:MOSC domain-containing protein
MATIVSGQTELRQQIIPVGVIEQLSRYPVKSMHAEPLTEAEVTLHGVSGDRRFAFIQGNDHSRFPWLTSREIPRMMLYRASFVDRSDPDISPVLVTTPDGRQLDLFSQELLEELRGQLKPRLRNQPIFPVHLSSAFDSAHFSLVTTHALHKLSGLLGEDVEPRRFRANVIIDTASGAQPDEQTWIGSRIIIGDGDDATEVVITKGDPRCMMPNLHPDTAVQDPRVLRTIARKQDNIMGVYGCVVKRGRIRVGDLVRLVSAQ